MQALAKTPLMPSATVGGPSTGAPGRPNQSTLAYKAATAEKPANSRTSRLSHERRHIFSARYAWIGRPRWSVEAASATAPTKSVVTPAEPRPTAPSTCNSQSVANAPTESCVSTVMITSGQCGSAGATCVRPGGFAFGASASGTVTRVVENEPSPAGTPAGGR